jgi:hypothetical protein
MYNISRWLTLLIFNTNHSNSSLSQSKALSISHSQSPNQNKPKLNPATPTLQPPSYFSNLLTSHIITSPKHPPFPPKKKTKHTPPSHSERRRLTPNICPTCITHRYPHSAIYIFTRRSFQSGHRRLTCFWWAWNRVSPISVERVERPW